MSSAPLISAPGRLQEDGRSRLYPFADSSTAGTQYPKETAGKMSQLLIQQYLNELSDLRRASGSGRESIVSEAFKDLLKGYAKSHDLIFLPQYDLPKQDGNRRTVDGALVYDVRVPFGYWEAKDEEDDLARRPEMETKDDKLEFLNNSRLSLLEVEEVRPDAKSNWINLSDNDFSTLLPIGDRETKAAKSPTHEHAIFKIYSLGVATNRDEWVFDFSLENLRWKVEYLIDAYNADVRKLGRKGAAKKVVDALDYSIKWTRAVKRDLGKGAIYKFDAEKIIVGNYRPFVSMYFYRDNSLNEMPNLTPRFFGAGEVRNPAMVIMGDSSGKPYLSLAIDRIPDLNFVSPASGGTQTFAIKRIEADGTLTDNVTDWALAQFRAQYEGGKKSKRPITKQAIFYYVYGVLHDPIYREKYAQNLKREFPRIPFYSDFWKWAEWGERLTALHTGYETVNPWKLERIDVPDEKSKKARLPPKPSLKADKDNGVIVLDSETQLTGVPPEAWTYRLGNRSALEWILDQYKEKTPKDPTIREKFNTYRFADHKEKVIDLLKRVTRVSLETMTIVEAMKAEKR